MRGRWLVLMVMLLGWSACSRQWELRSGQRVTDVDPHAGVIQIHLRNRELYVLSSWLVDDKTRTVVGSGSHLSAARVPLQHGSFRIPLDSVIFFESHRREPVSDETLYKYILTTAGVAAFVVFVVAPSMGSLLDIESLEHHHSRGSP